MLDGKLAEFQGAPVRRRQPGPRQPSLARSTAELARLLDYLQGADATPTTVLEASTKDRVAELQRLLQRWKETREKDIADLNEKLKAARLRPLDPAAPVTQKSPRSRR